MDSNSGIRPAKTALPQVPIEVDGDEEFRLDPRRVKWVRREATAVAFTAIMKAARNTAAKHSGQAPRHYYQRCMVKVRYLRNKIGGGPPWRAHAQYIARQSATEKPRDKSGFDPDSKPVDVVKLATKWQTAGDPRMYKIVISPESPGVDLQKLTRDTVKQMEKDLGRKLEWAAVIHRDREHHHVHMILRGVDRSGQVMRLDRDYVRFGIRQIAADLCTRQLGYRLSITPEPTRRYGLVELPKQQSRNVAHNR